MKPAVEFIDRASDLLARATSVAVVLAAAGFCLALLLQVAFRYVLNAPLSWSEELATFLFVWATLLAASAAVRFGEHLRLTFLEELLAPGAGKWAGCLCQLLMAGFGLFLVRDGWRLAELVWTNTSAAIGFPLGYLYVAVPVSGCLITFHSVALLLSVLFLSGNRHPIMGKLS